MNAVNFLPFNSINRYTRTEYALHEIEPRSQDRLLIHGAKIQTSINQYEAVGSVRARAMAKNAGD